jgi:hypothetical protein
MTDLLLTRRELYDLTLYKQAKSQVRTLRDWGIPFVIGRDGRPRVLREHLKVLAGAGAVARREAEPNLEGLTRR